MHLMIWDKPCLLKELGGLNFKDLEGFNQAPLASQVWKVVTSHDLLVSKVLKARYFQVLWLYADLGAKLCYFFRSFLLGRGLQLKGIRRRVGNEKSIFVFMNRWIPRESNLKPIHFPLQDSMICWWLTSLLRMRNGMFKS